MPSDANAAAINSAAIAELLSYARLYGPNGVAHLSDGSAEGPPPADVVAALERLETATVDPTLLTGSQTVASVEEQTITDLGFVARNTRDQLSAATGPYYIGQPAALNSLLYPKYVASLKEDVKLFTPGASNPPVTVISPPPPPASGVEQYLVENMTTGVVDWEDGQAYAGPVANVQNQFLGITTDKLNITATKPNNFIRTGSGDDAIDLSLFGASGGGTNVVDGGGGSNFVIASLFGDGSDTVLIDTRAATADTWTTVANFAKGDAFTIYGVSPSAALDWEDGQGAAGFTGLTLHVVVPGRPIASLTLASGYFEHSKADLSSGRLAASFGNDTASGSSYLHVEQTAY